MQRQYTYERPEGRVYVIIESAEEKDDWTPDGRVKRLVPYVEVSTRSLYADDGTDKTGEQGYLKVGNHRYSLHGRYQPTPEHMLTYEWKSGPPQPWTTSGLPVPYDGGIHRESGTKVDYDSPVLRKVEDIAMAALTAFALEVPDWAERSIALRLEAEYQAGLRHEEDLKGQMEAAVGATDKAQAALKEHLIKHGLEWQ